jgi:tRNA nucleotidyltransferase (CCA-adding enzyme)
VERSSVEQSSAGLAPPDSTAVLERLRKLPGGRELLELAEGRADIELIGGSVRDLLLDARGTPRELDVVVAHDSAGLAGSLAEKLSRDHRPGVDTPSPHVHDRFGTATVEWPGGRVDIAERRSERYAYPGALPEVGPGTVEQDLARRDFTVNTISVRLGGPDQGELRCADGALEDLAARRLRVLHQRSFLDDPTRLLRMARYAARLGFEPDEHTARLAEQAIAAGALDTVSPARIGAELRLAFAEPDPVHALESLARLGVLSALHEAIELDASLARAALAELPSPPDAWPDVLLLASLLRPGHSYDSTDYQTRLRALLDGYEFPGPERERAVRSAILSPRIAERLQGASKPSQIYAIAHDEPLEAVALGGAIAGAAGHSDAAGAAQRWLSQLRHVELKIGGDDLLTAGVPRGPGIGRRLSYALMLKLDGELDDTREAELRAALRPQSERVAPKWR